MNRYKLSYVIEQVQANPWALEKAEDPVGILTALGLHELLTAAERELAAREISDFLEAERPREHHQMAVCALT